MQFTYTIIMTVAAGDETNNVNDNAEVQSKINII